MNCSAIILAAGRSERMQGAKFLLRTSKNRTFLEEIITKYALFGCNQIIVVLNEKGYEHVRQSTFDLPEQVLFVKNMNLEWERFYSIKLGCKNVFGDNPVFIHNVDNPFVKTNVLNKLLAKSECDYVVPTCDNRGGHPILISKKVIDAIASEKQNDLILSDFLQRFDKTKVEVHDKTVLTNINTIEDYLLTRF